MRAQQFTSSETKKAGSGPVTMVAAIAGCFAVGFAALFAIPRIWPHYVQVPVATDAQPVHVTEVGTTAAPRPKAAAGSTDPALVTTIKPAGEAPAPQTISRITPQVR